jgi:hypothetical protein
MTDTTLLKQRKCYFSNYTFHPIFDKDSRRMDEQSVTSIFFDWKLKKLGHLSETWFTRVSALAGMFECCSVLQVENTCLKDMDSQIRSLLMETVFLSPVIWGTSPPFVLEYYSFFRALSLFL